MVGRKIYSSTEFAEKFKDIDEMINFQQGLFVKDYFIDYGSGGESLVNPTVITPSGEKQKIKDIEFFLKKNTLICGNREHIEKVNAYKLYLIGEYLRFYSSSI